MDIQRFDIAKLYPGLYAAEQKRPKVVQVPALRILAVQGQGDPGTESFQHSVEALYATTYAIKFMPKKGYEVENYEDFKTSALEALWSMQNGQEFDVKRKDLWQWEVFIVVPGFFTPNLVAQATNMLKPRKPNPKYEDLHIKTLEEKQAVQILHVGSYENEAANLKLLQQFLDKNNLKVSGPHHEIYLSDPRRVAEGRLKTILRWPVVKESVQ
ncbi:GyrI-like domain-containing protein [Candidatus Saccharibacteria bacterium]|nr:GyrI-like domain-containing protein [Candidatus Saccharibacteria bacterium]